jgi:heme-degrading monooxygenase HmoA
MRGDDMYARVTYTETRPEWRDKGVALYRDSVVPAAQEQEGFKGVLLLNDFATGKAISITLWDTEEHLKACEASGYYQEQLAKYKDAFSAPPSHEQYEVTVQA